jgi:hypothetical protein
MLTKSVQRELSWTTTDRQEAPDAANFAVVFTGD